MNRLTFLFVLFELVCSHVSADLATEAIVGGHHARKGDFKYQVSLESQGVHYCGGCIIAEQYILTTAHCVTDENGNIINHPTRVIAGTHNLKEWKHDIAVAVETVYIPKEFNRQTYQNDIAVLKLKKALNLSSHSKKIEKIGLALGFTDLTGVIAVVSGFGLQNMKIHKNNLGEYVELGGTSDGKLKFAEAKIISHNKCVEMNKPQIIFQTNICGQVLQHNKHPYEGVCSGDSGGPLVYRGEVIGVLSKSPFACDEKSRSAIYTSVSSYLNLIHNVIMGKPGNDVHSAKLPS